MEPENAGIDIKIAAAQKQINEENHELMDPLFKLSKEGAMNVRSVKLSCNSYGSEVLKKVGEVLRNAKNFEVLDLSDCFMKRKHEAICDGIYNLFKPLAVENMKSINISNNALGTTGSRTFGSVLEKAINLKELLIANCGLGGIGAKEVLDKIFWCQHLQTLSMGKNRMEIDGGIALGDAMKHLLQLKKLYVFQNGIRESGMQHLLFEINQHLVHLQTLDISENFIAGASNEQFFKILSNPKLKIKDLNIADSFDKADVPKVIQVLMKRDPPIIERLGLNYLEIRKAIGQKLLAYLQKCNLKQLDVMETNMPKPLRKSYEEKLGEKLQNPLVFEDEDNDEATLVNAFGSLKIK